MHEVIVAEAGQSSALGSCLMLTNRLCIEIVLVQQGVSRNNS